MTRSQVMRADYFTQLPPEILEVIFHACVEWFKPKIIRGQRKSRIKYNTDEIAITQIIIWSISATCRYFRDVISAMTFTYNTKQSPESFVLYNNTAFDNLLLIASNDFIKMILRPKPQRNDFNGRIWASGKSIFPRVNSIQTVLINHIVESGPANLLIDLKRAGYLRDYVYNASAGSIVGVAMERSPTVCYAARYRQIDDVYDLNRHVEGVTSNVAVRVVNNWISRMFRSRRLHQNNLDKALNLIIRTHPDQAWQTFNFVLRMRSSALRRNNPYHAFRFNIDDNELALYSCLRGTGAYSRYLMMRLDERHRMRILAMLPIAKDKFAYIMVNWDLTITRELMEVACSQGNNNLAQFCREYYDEKKDPQMHAQLRYIYSKRFCKSGGECCLIPRNSNAYIGADSNSIALRRNTSNCTVIPNQIATISSESAVGLCYQGLLSSNYNIRSEVTLCNCDSYYDNSSNVSDTLFTSFASNSGDYQPSGSVNFSRIRSYGQRPPRRDDPAAKFIRSDVMPSYNFITSAYTRYTPPAFGRSVSVGIPRYGDLMPNDRMSDITVTLPPITIPTYADNDFNVISANIINSYYGLTDD
ncbi:hypothetical protein F-LCD7_0189 [Faustovirus]|nr:hypothetical protein F-LCD7_0189 [Faustovirus]